MAHTKAPNPRVSAMPRSSGKLPLDHTTPIYLKRIQTRTLELLQELASFREFLTDRSRSADVARSVQESQAVMQLQTLVAEVKKLEEVLVSSSSEKKR